MDREAAVLRRESDDVGRIVCGVRPVVHAERASTTFENDCARGGGSSGTGFPVSVQYFCAVRHAVADVYERAHGKRADLREQGVLAAEGEGNVPAAPGFRGLRQADGKSVAGFSEMDAAPGAGCLLRCAGADARGVQGDECADPDDYRAL